MLIFEMLFINELNLESNKTLFAPNSLRDSACEYLIALSHIFGFYSCLLGILFTFFLFSISAILDLIMTLANVETPSHLKLLTKRVLNFSI